MAKVFLYYAGRMLPEELADTLPLWRREILSRIHNGKVRQESMAAGLLFAYAAARCGVLADDEPVKLLEAGKPVFAARNDLYFSLSHSDGWVACAVDRTSIGVDIQKERAVKDSMLRRFHPDEQAYYFGVPEALRRREFFRLWTRKEAWVKAESNDRFLSLAEYNVLSEDETYYFQDYCPAEHVFAAVCTHSSCDAEIIRVGENELLAGR